MSTDKTTTSLELPDRDENLNPAKMEPFEIESEIIARRQAIEHIKTQLADDKRDGFARGASWRHRAHDAITWLSKESDELQLEQTSRIAEIDRRQRYERSQRFQVDAANRRDKDRAARHEAMMARQKTRKEMFVSAAYAVFGKGECERVWRKAREMFPDGAWSESDV